MIGYMKYMTNKNRTRIRGNGIRLIICKRKGGTIITGQQVLMYKDVKNRKAVCVITNKDYKNR